MADPNDFTNENEPEGGKEGNPKAGYPGVGGLSTQDAEDAYTKANEQHFTDDTTSQANPKNKQKQNEEKSNQNTRTMPQIGSIDESHEQDID